MTEQNPLATPFLRAVLASIVALAVLAAGASAADSGGVAASTGGTSTTEESDSTGSAPSGDGKQTDDAEPTGQVRLRRMATSPVKTFAYGRTAKFRFSLRGKRPRDVRVKLIRKSDRKVLRRWRRKDVPPGEDRVIRWNGLRKKRPAPAGRYVFRVFDRNGQKADTRKARGRKRVDLYGHKFPFRGRHSYGDSIGAGRGHQGQDIFGRCGAPIVAARGGRVQWRRYHGAAGYYVVIDGAGTQRDYVYMHLQRRGMPREGQRVRTGERIGFNGETGNASGCHLHFELWSGPGWYEGGHHLNPTPAMKRWDSWS